MKTKFIISIIAMISILLSAFCSCKPNKREVEAHVWLYESGYHLDDLIIISDTFNVTYRLVENDSIHNGEKVIALVESVSMEQLVIKNLHTQEKGYYSHFMDIEQHIRNISEAYVKNIELNKLAVGLELSGNVTTKYWMENGYLEVKLDNKVSGFPNCFLDHEMDSLELGDSIYKAPGENVCHIFKKDGRIVDVNFVNNLIIR